MHLKALRMNFMRAAIAIACIMVISLVAIGVTRYVYLPWLAVSHIHNDNIDWDGNFIGLWPTPGVDESQVLAAGPACRPFLIAALDDDDRYVAAHVILTQMSRREYSISGAAWNKLEVDLYGNGKVVIPNGQREKIKRLWTDK
jgi:hypothetical protein